MSIFSTPSQIQLFPLFLQTLLLGIYTCLSISRWLDLSYSHSGQVPSSTYLCATLKCLPNHSGSLRAASTTASPSLWSLNSSSISNTFINHLTIMPESPSIFTLTSLPGVSVCVSKSGHTQDAEHPSLWMAKEGRARTFSLSLIPKDFSRCQRWDAQRTREEPPSPTAA